MSDKKSSSKQTTNHPKRLLRSRQHKIIAGVSAGLGEFFNLDPVIFRIAFLILLFVQGVGFILYILMWLIIPVSGKGGNHVDTVSEGASEIKDTAERVLSKLESKHRPGSNRFVGIFVVSLGVILLLNNFGMISWVKIEKLWPLLIIIFGFSLLLNRDKNS